MYSGGDLAKLFNEKPATPHLKQTLTPVEAGSKGRQYSPCFAACLTLLNDLAQHDLNFQNLLVLHNLVNLGLDFGEGRRHSDHRLPSWERKRNCLAELVESFRKQENSEERGHSTSVHRSSSIAESNNPAAGKGPLPSVVMGYPAAEFRESVSPDRPVHNYPGQNGLTWDVHRQDRHLAPYPHDEWSRPHWNSWHTGGPMAGTATGLQRSVSREESESLSRELVEETSSRGEKEEYPVQSPSLQRCNSWSETAGPSQSETKSPMGDANRDFCSVPNGYQSSSAPYSLEQEIQTDRRSDLERFMDSATPMLSVPFSYSQSPDPSSSFTMEDIWEFYDIPCVYGLQIPFLKGGKSVSFAHFVPSLSAIRLFVPGTSELSLEGEVYACDMPQFPSSMRLVFEFFETLKPHVRPPLTEEIQRLERGGIAGKILPNLPLSEIHPVSWFSVAWYPIYCIPEGKLRTSFLTFHSFGSAATMPHHLTPEMQLLQAPLIGIKFMGLSPDGWVRPRPNTADHTVDHTSTVGTSPQLTPGRERHDTTAKHGHTRRHDGRVRHEPESPSVERHQDLEQKIELLQSHAERLARASYRRRCTPGHSRGVDSASPPPPPLKCYHSDFEFFDLRS